MLTTDDLAGMRATAGAALPDSCVIQTQAWVSDGGGGGTTTWTAAGTVDCRIAPLNGSERDTGDRISSHAEYVVTLPFDASVSTDSRLVINGDTFNVAAIRDRSWNVSTRVEVVKEV